MTNEIILCLLRLGKTISLHNTEKVSTKNSNINNIKYVENLNPSN